MGRTRRNPFGDSGGNSYSNGVASWTEETLSASAAAVSFALLLTGSLLAQPCLSAPNSPRLDPSPWHHPCGANKQETGVEAPASPHPRHPAMKALKRVRTQIRIASEHYAKEKRNIDVLHQELKEFKDIMIVYSWLPDKQFAWYEAEAKCQPRHKRLSLILPQLHSSLQRYSVTLEEVNRFPHVVNEPMDVAKTRKRVLFELAKEVKKWLCEVETALISSGIPVPSRTKEEIIPRDDLDRWHSEPSHTTSLVQTWGVLSAYHRFTQEWHKIFKSALDAKVPASCSSQQPAKKKPVGTKRPASGAAKTTSAAPKKPSAGGARSTPAAPKKPSAGGARTTPSAAKKPITKKRKVVQPKN